MCEIYGAQSINLEFEWGKSIDLERVKEVLENEDVKVLTAVHNETSTGAVNPIKELGELAKEYGALFVVDAISSLGGIEVKVDEWNIDVCISSSQKCLGGLYGLSILSISDAAWEAMENRKVKPRSYAYDLLKWKMRWIPKEEGGLLVMGRRSYPLPPPTHLIYALNEACKMILEEGLNQRFKRHQTIAYATREGVKSIGLEIFPDEEIASSTVTVIKVPKGVSDSDIVDGMLKEHKIMIAKGLRRLKGKVIRIGHMANTADQNHIIPTLAALEDVLYKFKVISEKGIAVETALNIIEKQLEI
ncbi:aminotransferase [Candidatus Bathyarchaeota archaeon]|nr:MAG: aminotransferase [Candidatus Bathyarchaeota archaeon]